jgi:hypothetical protein
MIEKEPSNQTRRGSAPLIALLVLAISSAFTASIGVTLLKLVEDTLPQESVPVIVAQREASVEVINTASLAIDLSMLSIYINDRAAAIVDEDKDGIWEPNEKLTIDFGQLDDVSTVAIYYGNQVVYKAIYVKPVTLHHDTVFPDITYKREGSRYSVNVKDDTSIVAVNIYAGYEDGERLAFSFSPLTEGEIDKLMSCYDDYRKTGEWACEVKTVQFTLEWSKEGNGTPITIVYSGNAHKSSSDKKIYFARVETFDITGKASSVVLVTDSPPSVVLTSPPKGAKYVAPNPISIPISAIAEDDFRVVKIELYLDGNLLKTCENTTSCDAAASVGHGAHTAMAVAYDTEGQRASDTAIFEIDSDAPPVVVISNPKEGGRITTPGGTARFTIAASASDDFGLSNVEVYLDYLKLEEYRLNGEKEFSISLPAEAGEGDHIVEVFAYDISGKNSSAKVRFSVIVPHVKILSVSVPQVYWQNQTPTNVTAPFTQGPINIKITSPAPGSYYGPSSQVYVSASVSSYYGLSKIIVYHSGVSYTAYTDLGGVQTYSFSYSTSCITADYFVSGTNEIRIFAYDIAGNIESEAVQFSANPKNVG